jgi:hypothetical protein
MPLLGWIRPLKTYPQDLRKVSWLAMAPFASGFRMNGVGPADDWRDSKSKLTQETMNFQNTLRSRFVPLAPLSPPAQRGRFVPLVPRVTQVIPPAPQDSEMTIDPRLDGVGMVQGDYSITGHPLHEFGHLLWVDATGHLQLTPHSATTLPSLQTSPRSQGDSIHASAWGWVILAQRIRSLFGTLGEAWSHVATVSATMVASQLMLRESDATPQTLFQPVSTATSAKSRPTKTRTHPAIRLLSPLHSRSSG